MSLHEDMVLELNTDVEMQEVFKFLIETAEQHNTSESLINSIPEKELFNFFIQTNEEQDIASPSTPTTSNAVIEWPAKKMIPFKLDRNPLRHQIHWMGSPVDPRGEKPNYGKRTHISELEFLADYTTGANKTQQQDERSLNKGTGNSTRARHRGRASKKRNQRRHNLIRKKIL